MSNVISLKKDNDNKSIDTYNISLFIFHLLKNELPFGKISSIISRIKFEDNKSNKISDQVRDDERAMFNYAQSLANLLIEA